MTVELAIHRAAVEGGSADPFVIGPMQLAVPTGTGELAGLSFVAKDLFDVAGTRTGCGNPDRLAQAPIAPRHAPAVSALLEAGATLMGKTVTDELAFSLSGTNVHYGTPVNPAAPGRVPGGSSSGSVSAVASGLVDVALGTDTGGSVRVPASYCGVVGLRPSHGLISGEGVMLLAPSFCTVGLFVKDARLLAPAWRALHSGAGTRRDLDARPLRRFVVVPELFALADEEAEAALLRALEELALCVGASVETRHFAGQNEPSALRDTFRTIQMFEAWQLHGPWIAATQPRLGPGIAARFAAASQVSEGQVEKAYTARAAFQTWLGELLGTDGFVVQPAASGPAPPAEIDPSQKDELRARTLALTAVGGLLGGPMVSLPLASVAGRPVGLGVLGMFGDEDTLVELAALA